MLKTCSNCGKQFVTLQKTALYCSKKCKQQVQNARWYANHRDAHIARQMEAKRRRHPTERLDAAQAAISEIAAVAAHNAPARTVLERLTDAAERYRRAVHADPADPNELAAAAASLDQALNALED